MRSIVLLLLYLLLLYIRYLAVKPPQYSDGTRLRITANLKEEPSVTGGIQRFALAGIDIQAYLFPAFHYGDHLAVAGIIKNGVMPFPEIQTVKDVSKEWNLRGMLISFRGKVEDFYERSLPEPQAGLLSGMVLGSKSGLSKEFTEKLKLTGTMHVVIASGMNVMIVGSTTLTMLLFFLSRRQAVILSVIIIWIYVVLAGGEVPVVRAGIMGTIVFLSQVLGRESDGWRALAFSGGLLLLINPLYLIDLGFQLSFAATAGILFFNRRFDRLFSRVPKQIRGDLTQTLAAQIVTMPIILSNFGFYSIWSPLVNILIAFCLAPIMKLGILVGLVGLIFAPVGQVIAWLVLPLLTYFVQVVNIFAQI